MSLSNLKALFLAPILSVAAGCSASPSTVSPSLTEGNSGSVALNLTTQVVEADFCNFDAQPSGASCRETSNTDFQSASATACAMDSNSHWPNSDTWTWAPTCTRGAVSTQAASLSSVDYVWCQNRKKIDFGDIGSTEIFRTDGQLAKVAAKSGQTVFEIHASYEYPGTSTVTGTIEILPEGPVEVRLDEGNEDGTWRTIGRAFANPTSRRHVEDNVIEVRADMYDPGAPVRFVVVGGAGLAGEKTVYIGHAKLSIPTCLRDAQGVCR